MNSKDNKSLAIRGTLWTTLGFGASQVIRLGGNLILTRLLAPEAFGLMSLVAVFMSGLAMFSDLGIGPSIISSARSNDPRFLNSAWTLQIFRGFFLAVATCVLAYPYAAFYEQPILFGLLIVTAFNPCINGFNSTKLATSGRAIALARITLIELGSQLLSTVVMVVWVYFTRDVWGLVYGGLAGGLCKAILTHMALPGLSNWFAWEPAAIRDLLHFGKWIFLSTLMTYAAGQADRIIFGKQLPLDMLGIYANAAIIAGLPVQVFMRFSTTVLFPMYRRMMDAGRRIGDVFERLRQPLLVVGGVAISWLIICGPALVSLLYDERYAEGGQMIRILGVGVWFQFLGATTGAALLASGRPRVIALGNIAKLVVFLGCCFVSFRYFDLMQAIWAVVAGEASKYVVLALGVRPIVSSVFKKDLQLTAFVAATTALGIFISTFLEQIPAIALLFVMLMLLCLLWWYPLQSVLRLVPLKQLPLFRSYFAKRSTQNFQ